MFKKFAVVTAMALVAAGCSEAARDPMGVDGPAFDANHTLIPAPAVTSSSTSSSATVEWTWSDVEPWDLVSFTVKRDGVELDADIPNAKPYGLNELERSFTEEDLNPGAYEYCVEVMAKYYSAAQERTLTEHSFACTTVVVGSPQFSIALTGGNIANATHNANAALFTLNFEVRLGSTVITDCSDPGVGATVTTAVVKQITCDPLTGARTLQIHNPSKDVPGSYTAHFTVASVNVLNFPFTSVQNGGPTTTSARKK